MHCVKTPNRWLSTMVMTCTFLLSFCRQAQGFRPQGSSFRLPTRCTAGQLLVQSRPMTSLKSTPEESTESPVEPAEPVPLLLAEGLFSVAKPLDWTSSDVVSYVRGILERDARNRGAKPVRVGSRRNKSKIIKVGHGGTLDPLATGVLVIGVGKGTKLLQGYLTGAKRYRAGAELGYETNTLDMEGNVTKTADFEHVTLQMVQDVLPQFEGKIMQVPPIFSALKRGGKKLYQQAREGVTTDDIEIEAREVEVYKCELLNPDESKLPKFEIDVECGGGTYIRSLIRDIGYTLDSVATTTLLERTQQSQFHLEDSLPKDDWSADNFYAAIDRFKAAEEAAQES